MLTGEKDAIYKCSICGNVVSMIDAKEPTPVCCGKEMNKLPELYSENEGNEKHVPILEKVEGGVKVSVGSIHHTMEEDHLIEFIELLHNGRVIKTKRLSPGEEPVAIFKCKAPFEELSAREFCNKHGLWRS